MQTAQFTAPHDAADIAQRPACKYRCLMETRGGMYAQYDGFVEVWCRSDDWADVFQAAVRELRRTSFPDYSAGMWRMVDFNRVG